MIISLDAENVFDKNPTPLHNKSPREIRDTRDILQYNKSNLQKDYNQHQIKLNIFHQNHEKDKVFPYLFNIVLEVLTMATSN